MKNSWIQFGCLVLLVGGFVGCTHEAATPPENPFDKIDYGGKTVVETPPDSASLVGLHQYIFSVSCAVPGCHDGSFEPDYRTVQSTYNTLVYQPVIKNDQQGSYTYRVVPNDVDGSWLYNRVTTDDQTLGRMPLYDNPLTEGQLQAIRDWINAGAPDVFGQATYMPNTQPQIRSVAAFLDVFGQEYRVDTIRGGNPANPFGTLSGRNLTIWLALADDSTDLGSLQDTRFMFSSDFDDFSNAVEVNATYSPTPKVVPDYIFGGGAPVEFYWKVEINTGDFPLNAVTFFRFLTNDGNHLEDLVFPDDPHPLWLKAFMAFYVAP